MHIHYQNCNLKIKKKGKWVKEKAIPLLLRSLISSRQGKKKLKLTLAGSTAGNILPGQSHLYQHRLLYTVNI